MLKLKKHLSFALPTLTLGSPQPLVLSPVPDEDDELIQEINGQADDHDDTWTLEPTPDVEALETKWSEIQQDVEHDPSWNTFDED